MHTLKARLAKSLSRAEARLLDTLADWSHDFWAAAIGLVRRSEWAMTLRLKKDYLAKLQAATLSEMLVRTEADRRAMRDSVVDHMASEEKLRHEISSLKRHLSMAIDQRDKARSERRKKQ